MRRAALALASLIVVACTACGGAVVDRPAPTPRGAAKAPSPPPDPPPAVDGDFTFGRAGGVDVLVKKVPGAAFAAGQIYVRGGARNWTAVDAGIEQLAFTVATRGGTRSLEKTAWSRKLASLGAQVWPDVRSDVSALELLVPVSGWDEAFALLVDALRAPALSAAEVEVQRTKLLAELHKQDEDPDGRSRKLLRKQVFAGHPYANGPEGTIDSMTAIKADALAPYLEALRVKSRLLVVAVGDLDPSRVFDQVKRALGDLPAGSYVERPMPLLAFDASHLLTEKRAIPTNYCRTAFPAPRRVDADYVTGLVTINVLSDRIADEVRTKRNLSYAVSAYVENQLAIPFSAVYVTAVDANAAMKVILEQMRRLAEEPIGAEELAGFKAVFLTDYALEHETVEGQALALASAELYGKDWRLSRTTMDRVRAVGPADIQAYAKRHFIHGQASVLGDPTKVDAAVFTSL